MNGDVMGITTLAPFKFLMVALISLPQECIIAFTLLFSQIEADLQDSTWPLPSGAITGLNAQVREPV